MAPTIAITITDAESLASLKQAKKTARAMGGLSLLLELRIDLFRRLTLEAIQKRIQMLKKLRLPIIATIRSQKEGGGKKLTDEFRLELFKKILPNVNIIDVELSSDHLRKVLVPLARRKGKKVILSYHNFFSTPSESALVRLIRQGKRQGADIVKLAVTPRESQDLAHLLLVTHRYRKENLISLGMGRLGIPSRVLGFLFGSLVTYGSIGDKPHAPGQLPLARLVREIKNLL